MSTKSSAQSRWFTRAVPSATGSDCRSLPLSMFHRSKRKHLNNSGLVTCPCSVPIIDIYRAGYDTTTCGDVTQFIRNVDLLGEISLFHYSTDLF